MHNRTVLLVFFNLRAEMHLKVERAPLPSFLDRLHVVRNSPIKATRLSVNLLLSVYALIPQLTVFFLPFVLFRFFR